MTDTMVYKRDITRIWNPLFLNILVVNMTMNFGQFMMSTLIGTFADYLGATPTFVGLIVSAFSITCLLVKPVSGTIIDTFPKKKVLVAAISVTTIAFLAYSVSRSPVAVFAARLIHGLGMGFTTSTCLALAAEALPTDKMTQGIGYYSLAQTIASAVGPSLGLAMVNSWGFYNAFRVGAGVMALSAVLAATMQTRSPGTAIPRLQFSLNSMIAKEAIVPAVFLFFLALSYGTISSFLVLYAKNVRNVENIGLYFTVSAVCLLMTRPLIGKLGDRFGIHKVLLPAFVMYGTAMIVISYATSLTGFLLAAVINSFGYGASSPIIQALCMKSVPKERRGLASTTSYIGTDLGYLIGSPIAGSFVSGFGYEGMFRIMVIPILGAIALLIFTYPKIKAISLGK